MADLVNLDAESDRNIIGDDSTPTLTLENSSSGIALKGKVSGAAPAIQAERTSTAGPTIAPIRAIMSIASGAVFGIQGVFISTASMNTAATQTAFHIPVYHETQGVLGYIAVSKGVV